ncbi:distal tail protein Dit [Neobacillus ginsengisoli]|uniref:Phage tail protein n=1 Tax=Neobacillus ginsengisoli TaxID=904295 RepID=A0ABT9Y1Q9_9BACI|nr:distal tail protein Dit [Neobacillus ginsengisoli]MDQ0201671.1 hypothetical protein [Neobacillus ginsengisoli]
MADLQKIKEDLAKWLITDQPKELIFDDEPDRVYYAVVDGSLDLDEIVNKGRGVFNFICPDSYKYSVEKRFNVGGSVKSEPIFTCTVSKDTTYIAVSDGNKINLIGNPVKQEETPFDPQTPIYIGACNSLVGWTVSSATSVESSDITGTLKTDGSVFYTNDYGTSPIWHGPAMKTSLGSAVQDFRFDVGFSQTVKGNNQAGGIEVSLLDASNRIVAKLSMTKHFGGLSTLYSRLRAGTANSGFDVINEGGQANFQNAFEGVFRMWRQGNVWTAQVFKLVNGKFQSPITNTWTDKNGIASAAVTQVQARLIQRASFPVLEQKIADINVYRLNNPTAGQVPILARAGDIIEFNHQEDIIRRNGEDITKNKAFIGEYFPLLPGDVSITTEPADSVSNVEVRWRERWL